MRKKFEKKLEIKKKAVPLQSRSERGGTEEAEGSGKNRKRKFIEKTGRRQEKVPKKYERLFRPGDRTGDNRTGATGKIK